MCFMLKYLKGLLSQHIGIVILYQIVYVTVTRHVWLYANRNIHILCKAVTSNVYIDYICVAASTC